jgi:Protein of unknown function DUF115
MCFERNLQALRQPDGRHDRLIARLRQESNFSFSGEIPINSSLPVALPSPEADALFRQQARPLADQVHLLLGAGDGVLLRTAIAGSPGRVVLFEPELACLVTLLHQHDLTDLLGLPRMWVFTEEAPLIACIQAKMQNIAQLDVLLPPSEAQRLESCLASLQPRLAQMGADIALDYHSAANFHPQWLRQFFENLPFLIDASPLHTLVGAFAGKPAIIISRGPSLDAALPALQALQGHAVLIAVGGAVRRLWEAGITTDFALFYDANGMQEQRHGIPPQAWARIIPVIHPCAQPGCFEAFAGIAPPPFYFLTQYNKHLAAWLERVWPIEANNPAGALGNDALQANQKQPGLHAAKGSNALSLLAGGGTVSVIALRQALLMGCGPIVLLGQDLAFPNNQVYAGGIPLQTDALGQMNLTANETLYAEPEAMTTVMGQNGELLPASHAFPGFIRQLERIAAENAQQANPIPLYNASLGGAAIEGYPCRSLASFEGDWPAWKTPGQALPLPALSSDSVPSAASVTSVSSSPSSLHLWKSQRLKAALAAFQVDLQEAETLCQTLKTRLHRSGHDPAVLQAAIVEFGALLDRPGNAFLAFIPAFELQAFRQTFREVTAQRRQGFSGGTDLRQAFLNLLQKSHDLFAEIRLHAAKAEARLKQSESVMHGS